MRPLLQLAVASGALLTLGCYAEPVAITTPRPTPVPRVTILPTGSSASPVETATPAVATSSPAPSAIPTSVPGGSPSAGCVDGWTSPVSGTAELDEGIAILEGYMGVIGPWRVAELRYFTGPDSPGVIEPRFESVERWYIRAGLTTDPAFRGRWLIEKRTDQILGVAAVASWESSGYESPDWTGFIGEGPPQTYIGLPGQWAGIPYDFVTGERDGGQAGLPPEVVDCLAGS